MIVNKTEILNRVHDKLVSKVSFHPEVIKTLVYSKEIESLLPTMEFMYDEYPDDIVESIHDKCMGILIDLCR